jgi:hypothetical protein
VVVGPNGEATASEARWAGTGQVVPAGPDPGVNSNGILISNFK